MILPVLPGVRSKIPSEGTVKDLASRFDTIARIHGNETQIKKEEVESDQMTSFIALESRTEPRRVRFAEAREPLEDWEPLSRIAQQENRRNGNLQFSFIVIAVFVSLLWMFAREQILDQYYTIVELVKRDYPFFHEFITKYTDMAIELLMPILSKAQKSWEAVKPTLQSIFMKSRERWVQFMTAATSQNMVKKTYSHSAPAFENTVDELAPTIVGVFKEIGVSLRKASSFYYAMCGHAVFSVVNVDLKKHIAEMLGRVRALDWETFAHKIQIRGSDLFAEMKDFVATLGNESWREHYLYRLASQKVEFSVGTLALFGSGFLLFTFYILQ
jgi:hypothetical protein